MPKSDDDILRKIPQHFTESEEIVGLLKTVEEVIDEEVRPLYDQGSSLINPFEFPIELSDPYEESIDYQVPQIRGQSEESEREQLSRIFEWVRLKGLEQGLRAYMNSVGFFVDTEHMLSTDYESFTSVNNLPHDPIGFFNTPHTVVEFSPFESVDGTFLNQEIFRILKTRMEQLYPITTVPHYRFRVIGYADNQPGEVRRNEIIGSTTTDWDSQPARKLDRCHRTDDGVSLDRPFDKSYLNKVESWEVAYDTDLEATAEDPNQSIQNTDSLDNVLATGTNFTLDFSSPNSSQIKVDLPTSQLDGETINAIGFYDDFGELVLVFIFQPVTVFQPEDTVDGLDYRFTGVVLEDVLTVRGTVSEANDDQTVNDVRTALQPDYVRGYDEELALDGLLGLDQVWELDGSLNTTYLATLRDGGYWKLGENTSSFPGLDANGDPENEVLVCSDFDLSYRDDLSGLRFRTSLVRSPAFGHTVDQVVLYDSNDDPVIVCMFPPKTINGEDDAKAITIDVELIQ
jgi:hypothetical protein